jgi:D-alanine-D-alanine ligase
MKNLEAQVASARALLGTVNLGILAGGYSAESQGSLETVDDLLPYLRNVCKSVGVVLFDGKRDLVQRLEKWDFILNVCYGAGGEDGQLQGLMSVMDIPCSGSPVLASAIGMDKHIFKDLVRSWGFHTPAGVLASVIHDEAGWCLLGQPGPFVLKPLNEGDSEGIMLAESAGAVIAAVETIARGHRVNWLVEEYIAGEHGTIAVYSDGDELKISDPIVFELPASSRLYDKALKYRIEDPVPVHTLAASVGERITCEAATMYRALRCEGGVRFDFVVRQGVPYYLEVNTIPGLYPGSNSSRCFSRVMSFEQFLFITVAADIRRYQRCAGEATKWINSQAQAWQDV